MVDEVARLQEHPDPPGAQGRPGCLIAPGDPLARDQHVPAVRLVQAGQAGQQRGLAAPRRPGHRHQLARPHRDGHAAQCECLVVPGVEEAVELTPVHQRPVGRRPDGERLVGQRLVGQRPVSRRRPGRAG
jgi:hypothetical protein